MKKSTIDVPEDDTFKAHGLANYEIVGRIVRVTAVGPFNAEIIPAVNEVMAAMVAKLAASGPWGAIVTVSGSALAVPQALEDFTASLKARYVNPAARPRALAIVIPPEVEGASLMLPLFLKCYADAGVEGRGFAAAPDAQAWLEVKMA